MVPQSRHPQLLRSAVHPSSQLDPLQYWPHKMEPQSSELYIINASFTTKEKMNARKGEK